MKKLLVLSVIAVAVMAITGVSVHLTHAAFSLCSDGINNDPLQDNLIDAADPGCHIGGVLSGAYDPTLNSEFNTTSGTAPTLPQCSNGQDDDGDGKTDAVDPDCHTDLNAANSASYNPNDNSEFSSCLNGCTPPPPPPVCTTNCNPCTTGCTPPPPVNHAPVCPAIPARTVNNGSNVSFNYTASDPDGDVLTYSIFSLPSGASIDSVTGAFNWTPGAFQTGIYTPLFRVTDSHGLTCYASAQITVLSTVTPPPVCTTNCNPVQTTGGNTNTNTNTVTNNNTNTNTNNNSVVVYINGVPYNSNGGQIYYTGSTNPCTYNCGNNYNPCTYNCGTNYNNGNRAPIWSTTQTSYSVASGQYLQFNVYAYDPDGGYVYYSALNLPSGASFDANNKSFSWTPYTSGTYYVTFRATDNNSLYTDLFVTINVGNCYGGNCGGSGNRAPIWSTTQTNYYTNNGQYLQFYVSAYDPDGGYLTYSVLSLPSGASFDANNKSFSWTPYTNGTYTVTFRATDSTYLYTDLFVTINVGVNNGGTNTGAPVFTSTAPTYAAPYTLYTYNANAYSPSGRAITYSLLNGPAGLTIDALSGLVRWTPTYAQAGVSHSISISAFDGLYQMTQTFSVYVQYTGGVLSTNTGGTTGVVYASGNTGGIKTGTSGSATTVPAEKLSISNIRIDTDGQHNVILSWDTNKAASARAFYGLVSEQEKTNNFTYAFSSPEFSDLATHHSLNIGQLVAGQTYFIRMQSKAGNETVTSGEIAFTAPAITDNTINETSSSTGTLSSALETLGSILISPLLLIPLVILLLVLLFMRRRQEAAIETSSIDIRS